MKKTGKPLSELKQSMDVFPQVHINAHVKNENKHAYLEDLEIQQAIVIL
jgi:phosphoglucosamine mutase